MYAVGRIGSYISGGLYTVSSPFHVFSGAVDIVAVEQPDGSFKSSPWYVRFGKFQGVLKAKEKVVNINVNGVDANFQMYLDQRGRAYFLMEEEGEEEDSALYPSSDEMDRQSHKNARPVLKSKSCSYDANNSYDGMDGQLQKNTRPVLKSKSCNYDTKKSNTGYQIDANNRKTVARTNSRRSRILGLVFGHRSMRKEHYQEGYDDHTMVRISSWDRAEIAANLLEVQWSMNLATSKHREDNPLLFSVSDTSDVKKVNNTLSNDEQIRIGSSPHDIIEAGLDHSMSPEPTGFCNVKGETNPHSSFGEVECSVEESSVCMRSLSTMENVVETSIIGGSILGNKSEMISDISRNIDEPILCNDTAEDVISMVVTSDSQILCLSERSDKEQPYEQWDVAPASFNRYGKESGSDRAQAFMHFETSGRLTMETEASSVESHETLHIANRVPAKIHFDAETLLATAKLHLEDAIYQKMEMVEAEMAHVEACGDCPQPKNPLPFINGHDGLNLEEPPTESEPYAQTVTVAPIFNSAGGLAQFYGDSGLTKAVSISAFESLEDEQCLFSDLDGHRHRETQCESNLSVGINNENHSSFFLEGSGDGLSTANRKLCSSIDHSVQEDQLDGLEKFMGNLDASSGPIGVLKVHGVGGAEVEQAVKSLPNTWSFTGGLNNAGLSHPLSHSLDSNSKSQEWTGDARDKKCDTNLDAVNENQLTQEHSDKQVAHVSGHQNGSATSGEPSTVVAPDGNWRLWPFSLKKSRSSKTMQLPLYDSKISDSECVSDINIDAGRDSNMPKPKGRKKMVKANTPTSEQLALLNLKEGSNTVTFTFSTAMLGQQKVDARIYLWKWNTRIVISDVDGTITKSDVLGQFMPLMGVDWSQTGVAHLFSAIKENGYQLLFLSARAISQAYITRQFLFNLKQDGKALPDGPVVISPDGLFPSLFREVIRRTPHEFKIACLEGIRALFPHDYNPFYAGFGNRDTDEISYLKVGIPRGKIFIINPKGEVAVNRRVDTKSYTSLRTLVHSMFPPAASSEQENFNTWNYWKLPPPLIDV